MRAYRESWDTARRLIPLLAVVLVMAVAVSCSGFQAGQRAAGGAEEPNNAAPEGEPSGGSPEQDETGTAEEPSQTGAAVEDVSGEDTTGGEVGDPRLTDVVLTDEEGGSEPVETFQTRLDDRVYVSGETADLPDFTDLSAAWIAEDVPEYEEQEALAGEELHTETDYPEGDQPFEFYYEPSDPLAPGDYRVEVSLDGVVAETLKFTVVEPTVPVIARPARDLPNAPSAAPSDAPATELQFIVDASGSMFDRVDGIPKMDAARDALQTLVSALPDDSSNLDVGLRAYSHRQTEDPAASCEDTELLAPMQGVDKPELRDRIDGLRATGLKTPMANTVEQAAGDFPGGEGQNAAVLVTDGEENCVEDPVSVIEEAASEANLTVHVVGFDIAEAQTREQLQGIAGATGGIYVDARTPDELTDALRTIAEEEVQVIQARSGAGKLTFRTPENLAPDTFDELVLYDEAGDADNAVVEEFGYSREQSTNVYQLPPGTYTGELESSYGAFQFRVEIGPVQETVLEMGALRVRAPADTDTVYVEDQQTGYTSEGYGYSEDRNFLAGPLVVPPGSYNVLLQATSTSEPTTVAEGVEVEPGRIVEVTP